MQPKTLVQACDAAMSVLVVDEVGEQNGEDSDDCAYKNEISGNHFVPPGWKLPTAQRSSEDAGPVQIWWSAVRAGIATT